jgi:hypothetical protein
MGIPKEISQKALKDLLETMRKMIEDYYCALNDK